jgi:hypothetical protein
MNFPGLDNHFWDINHVCDVHHTFVVDDELGFSPCNDFD